MRPSDVATYVEAGAADIGITGKDVLAEQAERAVYELLDLRFGPCVMVVATTAGEDRLAEALRRLGVMRVATKYPRIAARHFERTGRQAEIVEVKGSVELAPLTGLAEGIVDLTATGHHAARERPRRARGDPHLHRAPDRQPRGAQDPGGGARRRGDAHAGGAAPWLSGSPSRRTTPDASRARARLRPRPGRPATRSSRDPRLGRGGWRPALLEHERRFGTVARPLRVPGELRAALDGLDPTVRAGLEVARANVGRVAAAGLGDDRDVELPEGQRVRLRELPVARAAVYAPGGRRPYPSSVIMGAVTARAAGVERARGRRARASGDPRRLRAVRCRRGLPHGRRPGDRRARVRDRDDRAGRRDRRARATSTSRRPSASSRAASGSTASRVRRTCSCSRPPARTRT